MRKSRFALMFCSLFARFRVEIVRAFSSSGASRATVISEEVARGWTTASRLSHIAVLVRCSRARRLRRNAIKVTLVLKPCSDAAIVCRQAVCDCVLKLFGKYWRKSSFETACCCVYICIYFAPYLLYMSRVGVFFGNGLCCDFVS